MCVIQLFSFFFSGSIVSRSVSLFLPLFVSPGSWECRRESKTTPIVVSDSSSTSDEDFSPGDSSSSNSDVEVLAVSSSSRRYPRPANYCLVVSIPLSLIKRRLKVAPRNTAKESSPVPKPSVDKSLPGMGESVLSAAGLKGLRSPLSLKLKRMSSSNNYAIVSSNVNGIITHRSFPVATSASPPVSTCSATSGNISSAVTDSDVTLSELCPAPCASTAVANVCLEPVATSASVTASSIVSSESAAKVSKSTAKRDLARVFPSLSGDHRVCVVSALKRSGSSSEFVPFNACPTPQSRPVAIEDTSAALPETGAVQVSDCYPVNSPVPGRCDAPWTIEENKLAAVGNGVCQPPPPVHSRPTDGFCFSRLFSFYPSDLKLQDNELVPVHSLSLKNADTIPDNHPVYAWTIGQAVESPRKRKKRLNH